MSATDAQADTTTASPATIDCGATNSHERRVEQTKFKLYWSAQPQSFLEDWKTIVGLILLLSVLYMPGIGSYGLYDPWETHYGEVARNMVETENYIDPFWGAAWDSGGVKRERQTFYSKPPLIMWMMSAGMNLFGFNEFGVRVFFPILMIMALVSIYLAMSRFFCRRIGLLAAFVSTTTPYIAFMSRQAVTDGPLVALMTIGMMFLGLALFKIDENESASRHSRWLTVAVLATIIVGQLWAIWPMDRSPDVVRAYTGNQGVFFAIQWWFSEVFAVGAGKGWAIALICVPLAAWTIVRVGRQRSRRLIYLYIFYVCCGLVVPAKGWLGWAPMGLAIVGYLCISGEWRRLLSVDVPTGLLIVVLSGHLWVIAMLAGHHPAWWNRFIIHDHYKRLFSGVHSIDSGGFEYFFRWIGYGLFPWIGLLPMAIVRCFAGLREQVSRYSPRQRFEVLLLLWAVGGFFLFSKSNTKFHHYILPVMPPLSILVALYLDDVLMRKVRFLGILLPCAAALTIWVGQDTYRMPEAYTQGSQNWVNLFTYKYDRQWAKYTPPDTLATLDAAKKNIAERENEWLSRLADPVRLMTFIAAFGLLLLTVRSPWIRESGGLFLAYASLWCTVWCMHSYLPAVAADWSQKGMWDAYYRDCTPYTPDEASSFRTHLLLTAERVPKKLDQFPKRWCREPIMAFRTNWRGEAFYSANTVLPALETKHLKPFLDRWGEKKPFYLFTERNRVKTELEPTLPKTLKGRYREVYGSHLKFVLLKIDPTIQPKKIKK